MDLLARWCWRRTLGILWEDGQVGPRANSAWNVPGGKNDKTEVILLPVHHEKAGLFGKDNTAGKHRRQQGRRKTKCETDGLHKRSQRHESTGAEQGCWGQDVVGITHSQGRQESAPTQWLVIHKGKDWCLAGSVGVVDCHQGLETPEMDSDTPKMLPSSWLSVGSLCAFNRLVRSMVLGNTEIWKIQFMFAKSIEFREGGRLVHQPHEFDEDSTKLKLKSVTIEYTV